MMFDVKGSMGSLWRRAVAICILYVSAYQCRKCDSTKALESRSDGRVVVHYEKDSCSHLPGSYAQLKKNGGKDGLPPSIRRFVSSFLHKLIDSPTADIRSIKADATVRAISKCLQNSQYCRQSEDKAALRDKIMSFFRNWKRKIVEANRDNAKASGDSIGEISSHKQLQAFVDLHKVPLDNVPEASLTPPKNLSELEHQALNILKIKPDDSYSSAGNTFVTLPIPEDKRLSELDKNGTIRNGMMVFTTLALLYNVVISSTKYNDIALCSVDVTWGISAANKNLVAVCLMANKEDGSQTVAPVAYGLLSSAESECTASSTMLAIRRAIKRLWHSICK